VRQVERDLVAVLEVDVLAQDAVVDLHRLLLEQLRLGRHHRALLTLGPRLGLQVVHVPALLDVELGQPELQVGQVRRVAALRDQLVRLADAAVDLEDVAAQLVDQFLLLFLPRDDRVLELAVRAAEAQLLQRALPQRERGDDGDDGGHCAVSSMQRDFSENR
jgi:hypothetical protein